MNESPDNIAGHTNTLQKLRSEVENAFWYIAERNVRERNYIDAVSRVALRHIDNAAREIDALKVQLVEARLLFLQRAKQVPLRDLMKGLGLHYIEPDKPYDWAPKLSELTAFEANMKRRELVEKMAEKCGFSVPTYWPYKNLSEAATDMGIDLSTLEDELTKADVSKTSGETVNGYLKIRREYGIHSEIEHNHFNCLACGHGDVPSEYYNLDEYHDKLLTCCKCGCLYTLLEGSWYAETGAFVTYTKPQPIKDLNEALVGMGIDPSELDLNDRYK